MTRSSRLLDLLQLLRGYRQPVTAKSLAEALEISLRTLYRDIASLMAMGAPVRGEAGVGYVLDSGFFLWPAIPTVIACGLSRRRADVTMAGGVHAAHSNSVLCRWFTQIVSRVCMQSGMSGPSSGAGLRPR
ncbi:HTH domain-containing protein [Asaia spathodeae]|uniref:helix-turn-helix transcriptional regulator n=1 Tax=Asaia spathodeae TaxID=657016 RepID=UPI002FC36094